MELKLDRNFFFMVIIFGVLVQYMVLSANDFRMPVKTEYYIDTHTHFSYQENNQINLWLYSDWMKIPFRTYDLHISIGDLLMVIGAVGLITAQYKIIKHRRKNERKNQV